MKKRRGRIELDMERRVLAITNQKGGVGKTTTAVNLSASLAVAEKNTLLIDIDPQANATSGCGIRPKDIDYSIYDVLVDRASVRDVIKPTEMPYLHILPSKMHLVGAELEFVNQPLREFFLRRVLKPIREEYDFIVIDCPPSLGLLTLNALAAADGVIIPLQAEYYAMEGINQLLNTIRLVKQKLNPQLVISGILITMFDGRLNLAKQILADVRSFFTDLVFQTVIYRNVKLGEAPSHGKPAILYDAVSIGAQSYMHLAQEILFDETQPFR
jgi:chromosome partitioning protein